MAEILAFAAGCQQAIGFHLDVRKYHGWWAKPKSQRNAESPRGERAAVLALAHRRSDQPHDVAAVLCALALALDKLGRHMLSTPLERLARARRGAVQVEGIGQT